LAMQNTAWLMIVSFYGEESDTDRAKPARCPH